MIGQSQGWSARQQVTQTQRYSFFGYHPGSSLLHRLPSWIKLLFVPCASIMCFCLPFWFSAALAGLQFIIACVLRISLKEQFKDSKPLLFYALILELIQITSVLNVAVEYAVALLDTTNVPELSDMMEVLKEPFSLAMMALWNGQPAILSMFLRLLAVVQCASLLYKTTTSLELRSGIEKIERAVVGKSRELRFTESIFMFLNFIPMVSKIFMDLQKAWIARGGKKNLKMYAVLFPVLFSVGMKKAWSMTRAIEARK